MAAKSLRDLFTEELRDAYDGEKRPLKALTQVGAGGDQRRASERLHQSREGNRGRLRSCLRGHCALCCASCRHADGRLASSLGKLSGVRGTADDHPHDDYVPRAATL